MTTAPAGRPAGAPPARSLRLVLDLTDVRELDPITLGTLAAAYHLGDDHRVAVFLDHSSAGLAHRLRAAGVPAHRIRHVP